MTDCCPISPAIVHRILAHFSPLIERLPPNLISKRLLQRHHFLNLTPDNAAEYLAWPSQSGESHVLDLQSLPNVDDHLSVQYTADSEDLLAHVRISPNLRLVFLWEQESGWQYHNLAPMPFPSDAYADFNDVRALYSPNDSLQVQNREIKASSDDENSYWNSYSGGDDDLDRPSSNSIKVLDESNSEDAYWARYSTIQGSADSTVPSPLPVPLKPAVPVSAPPNHSHPERVIVPPTEFRKQHVEPYNPLEPPSPGALTHRLEVLSREFGPLFCPESRSDIITPSLHLDHDSLTIPQESQYTTSSSSPLPRPADSSIVVNSIAQKGEHLQDLLKDSVKNLYKLWRSGRQDRSEDQDKELFISAVRHALDGL